MSNTKLFIEENRQWFCKWLSGVPLELEIMPGKWSKLTPYNPECPLNPDYLPMCLTMKNQKFREVLRDVEYHVYKDNKLYQVLHDVHGLPFFKANDPKTFILKMTYEGTELISRELYDPTD